MASFFWVLPIGCSLLVWTALRRLMSRSFQVSLKRYLKVGGSGARIGMEHSMLANVVLTILFLVTTVPGYEFRAWLVFTAVAVPWFRAFSHPLLLPASMGFYIVKRLALALTAQWVAAHGSVLWIPSVLPSVSYNAAFIAYASFWALVTAADIGRARAHPRARLSHVLYTQSMYWISWLYVSRWIDTAGSSPTSCVEVVLVEGFFYVVSSVPYNVLHYMSHVDQAFWNVHQCHHSLASFSGLDGAGSQSIVEYMWMYNFHSNHALASHLLVATRMFDMLHHSWTVYKTEYHTLHHYFPGYNIGLGFPFYDLVAEPLLKRHGVFVNDLELTQGLREELAERMHDISRVPFDIKEQRRLLASQNKESQHEACRRRRRCPNSKQEHSD